MAVTVVAELAAEAGVFTVVAGRLVRLAGGRAWVLWLLVVVFAVLSTAFLSLDTTAVLLTPVVVLLARHAGLPPLLFAMTTVWLANTASLVLPVSNLTNLLALHVLHFSDAGRWLALLGPAALVAVVVPCAVLAILFRRDLRARFARMPPEPVEDRALLIAASVVVVALLPLLVSGLPPWLPACAAAVALAAIFLLRGRRLRFGMLPWRLVLFAAALFLVVGILQSLGSTAALAVVTGRGDDPLSLLRLAGSGLVGANAADNLPAYLALEPVAGSPARIAALLIGVNAGPLITPWASLATLLWHSRLTALGVELRWRRYVLLGAIAAPLTVAAATAVLALSPTVGR